MKTHKIRPVLVETEKGENCILSFSSSINNISLGRKDYYYTKSYLYEIGAEAFKLILISLEDEKIEDGDTYYYGGMINKADTEYSLQVGIKISAKKVIATQDQLSPELVQQLVNEYNNGGMKDFEIEMEDWCDYDDDHPTEQLDKSDYRPKLTNGFVTPVKKKEPILYTEEEVKQIGLDFLKIRHNDHNHKYNTEDELWLEWFSTNKKK